MTQNDGTLCYDADFDPGACPERSRGRRAPLHQHLPVDQRLQIRRQRARHRNGRQRLLRRPLLHQPLRPLALRRLVQRPRSVPYANLTNPQTLNLYSMVSDDPESFADLDGHADCCDFWQVVNFLAGVANAYGSDNLAGAGRQQQDTTEGKLGAATGDLIATAQGAREFTVGGTGVATGVSLSATGEGALVGVPLVAVTLPVVAERSSCCDPRCRPSRRSCSRRYKRCIHAPVEQGPVP